MQATSIVPETDKCQYVFGRKYSLFFAGYGSVMPARYQAALDLKPFPR